MKKVVSIRHKVSFFVFFLRNSCLNHVRVSTYSANFSSRSGALSHSEARQEAALEKLRMATV